MLNARGGLSPWAVLLLGLAFAGAAVAFCLVVFGMALCDAVPHAGAVLQVWGLGVALSGLNRLPTVFGQPTVLMSLWRDLKRLLARSPESVTLDIQSAKHPHYTEHDFQIRQGKKYASDEERFTHLQEQIWTLNDYVYKVGASVVDLEAAVDRKVQEERAIRKREIEEVAKLTEAVTVADIASEWVALAVVLLGLILSSLPLFAGA